MKTGVLSDRCIMREHEIYNSEDNTEYPHKQLGLGIDPYDEFNVQPASYDLTLGSGFKIEPEFDEQTQSIEFGPADRESCEREQIIVQPGEFMLGHTKETVSLPNYITGEVKGRSSIGRLGLIPHTAGWIDPGFSGQITLEFVNHSSQSVKIHEGDRIAQIVFSYLNTPAEVPYGEKEDSKYYNQTGVTVSRIDEEQQRHG